MITLTRLCFLSIVMSVTPLTTFSLSAADFNNSITQKNSSNSSSTPYHCPNITAPTYYTPPSQPAPARAKPPSAPAPASASSTNNNSSSNGGIVFDSAKTTNPSPFVITH